MAVAGNFPDDNKTNNMAGNMSIKAKDLTVFIDIVRSKPVLYDICHPNYKDSATIKLNNWQDVIDEWFEVSNELLDRKYF